MVRNKEAVLEIVGDALIIAFGIFSAILFTYLVVNLGRGLLLFENNIYIRWAECIAAYAIILLGTNRAWYDLKRFRKGSK